MVPAQPSLGTATCREGGSDWHRQTLFNGSSDFIMKIAGIVCFETAQTSHPALCSVSWSRKCQEIDSTCWGAAGFSAQSGGTRELVAEKGARNPMDTGQLEGGLEDSVSPVWLCLQESKWAQREERGGLEGFVLAVLGVVP